MSPTTGRGQARRHPNHEDVIGGMFALQRCTTIDAGHETRSPFPGIRLVNASSAIWLALALSGRKRAWLPSYLCHSVVDAARRAEVEIRFYPVDESLDSADSTWTESLGDTDFALFIDYHGFPFNRAVVAAARRNGALVLRDASQALLSEPPGEFDFTAYSPRKFLGLPDGGLLEGDLGPGAEQVELTPPPGDWSEMALRASIERARFDIRGGDNLWFPLFRELAARAPIGPFGMSELSGFLLDHCFDVAETSQQRRDNYAVLAGALSPIALFPELPEGVVPLGFPVRVRHRDRLKQHLISNRIYPPVHWDLEGVVPASFESSHRLSRSTLTLPCDQRYTANDMRRIIDCMKSAESP